jgi:hypothetical protein
VREEIECVAYCKDDVKRKQEVPVWCVGKSEGWDSTGLPEGWYWYIAPKQTDSLLAHINTMIESLPDSAVGIERTQGRRLNYWH